MPETDVDRQNEELAREKVECHLCKDSDTRVEVKPLRENYQCDWMIVKDGITLGFAEFKRMNKDLQFLNDRGELWVSLTKFLFGESLVLKTGLPWVLFAQLDDAMIYHVMPPGSGFYRTGYFERVKEPCARVPMSRVFNIEDRSLLRVFLKHHEDTPETV